MKWISVEDRMPEQKVTVLMTDGEDVITGYWEGITEEHWEQINSTTRKLRVEHRTEWTFSGGYWIEPTHWMPLPDPPETG